MMNKRQEKDYLNRLVQCLSSGGAAEFREANEIYRRLHKGACEAVIREADIIFKKYLP